MYSLCPPDSRPYKKNSLFCMYARKKNFLCVFSSVQKLVLNRAKTNHLLRWRKSWFWIGPKPTTSCGDFLSLAVTSSRTLWLPQYTVTSSSVPLPCSFQEKVQLPASLRWASTRQRLFAGSIFLSGEESHSRAILSFSLSQAIDIITHELALPYLGKDCHIS